MGCFSCCFRIRDDHRSQINSFSQPITAIRKEPVDPLDSSCVWSLLAHEDEDEDLSQCEDGRYGVTGSSFLVDELRDEAKFLKACGTLPQTPVEIRRTAKSKDPQPHNGDTESTFNSRLPNTAIEDALHKQPDQLQSPVTVFQKCKNGSDSSSDSSNSLNGDTESTFNSRLPDTAIEDALHKQPDQLQSPVTVFQKCENGSDSSSDSSNSLNGNTESTFNSRLPNTAIEDTLHKQPDQLQSPTTVFQKCENGSDSSSDSSNSLKNIDSISSNSVEGCGIGPPASTHGKNKSVHFETQSDSCSFSSESSSPNIIKVPLKLNESSFDPTISKPSPYPTPLKLTDDMQTPGTVFPSYGKNPRIRVQYVYSGINPRNFSQLDTPIEEECMEQSDIESPISQVKLQESTAKKELNVCPTLSSWLPPKSNHEGFIDQSLTGQTPGDRPILGVVPLDWNADETSFTPKWGDVNGIPNTNNKYSEDQKVNWHATPFEERLEKALLEDEFIPKMKQLGETTCEF